MYFCCCVYVFVLLCMFCSVHSVSLCRSVYCLCVNVHCTTANGWQPNCSYQIYSYHIIYHISTRAKSSTIRLDNAVACISPVSDAYIKNSRY